MRNHGNFIVSLGLLTRVARDVGRSRSASTCSPGFAAVASADDDDGTVAGVQHRRHGPAQGWDSGARLRTRRRDPRAPHRPGRGLPRQPDEAADRAASSSMRTADPQTLRAGLQGAVAGARGARASPASSSTRSAGRSTQLPTAAASSITSIDDRRLRRLRGRPRLPRPAPAALRGLPAVQAPPEHSRRCSRAARSSSAGARTIAAGGWQSLPRLDMPGALLVGDAGGTLNFPKIKGIHQAIRCGMLAAEHLAATGAAARDSTRAGARPPAGRSCARCATSSRASSAACGSG